MGMTNKELLALQEDTILAYRASLETLEKAIARERKTMDEIEAVPTTEKLGGLIVQHASLPGAMVLALRHAAELRLLVQMRRQAGRFVDDSQEAPASEDDLYDGSDY